MQQALSAIKAAQRSHIDFDYKPHPNYMLDIIGKLEAELAKPEHANPAAKHWHDLYKAKCQEFHDKQTMLGTEIVALEEELAELKEEQLAKPEPVVSFTDNEEGLWIQLECNGSYYAQNLSDSKTAKFFVNAYRSRK